jgi:FtsP/CotA-like multicopper oxidase with cupredoxin domain
MTPRRKVSLVDAVDKSSAKLYQAMNLFRLLVTPFAFGLPFFAHAKEVRYDLSIAEQQVDLAGETVTAMTFNGGIPGPVLRFTEGDIAVIRVHNAMDVSSSIHWHGVLVPNDMDGTPAVTFPGIAAGTTFTYRFPIRQSGTYWYHSHTMLQEQKGVYGSIVILPKSGGVDPGHVVMLSDWTNKNPMEILRNLRRGSEFPVVEKHTAQSVLGAMKTGKLGAYLAREAMRMPAMDLADVAYDAFLTNGKPESQLAVKPGQTLRLRIIDGAASTFFHLTYAGGPITIVAADGQAVEPLKMKVPLLISIAETYDVLVPVPASGAYEFRATAQDGSGHTSLWIGSGGKHPVADLPKPFVYDTMMTFDWRNAFSLTPDGAMGMPNHEVKAGKFDKPGMNMESQMDGMDMGGSKKMKMAMEGMDHESMAGMEMSGMDHSKIEHSSVKTEVEMKSMDHPAMAKSDGMQGKGVKLNPPKWYDFLLRDDAAHAPLLASDGMMSEQRPLAPYDLLRAVRNTSYPASAPRREFRLTLDGDMNRYVWTLNNKPIQPGDDIHIRQGEVVRFIMINRSMMHHPMHLHGHFFRVINGQGNRSPLKHTVDVGPMSTTVIEFLADEPGDWFFHCHLLYHMMSGMGRIVKYEGYTPSPETAAVSDEIYKEANPWFFYGYADVLSNETQGTITLSNTLNIFSLKLEAGWKNTDGTDWEGELTYGRYFNRFTTVIAGVCAQGNDFDSETERGIVGFSYLLPGNFISHAWIDSDGEARVTLNRDLRLTPRLSIFGEVEYDTHDKEASQAGLSYMFTEYVSATALWDSDYGVGAGLTIRF